MSAPSVTEHEGRRLLDVARRAIAAHLAGQASSGRPEPVTAAGPSGAFVSLHRSDGELRGCIGFVEPRYELTEAVARAAVLAATEDPRFPAVAAKELPALILDVSVLGAPSPIEASDVVVGRHGLIVERGFRRGLLLPQVPVEHGWDRETFLDHTCLKAGLPPGAWREPDTRLLGFEAALFRERAPATA